MKQPDGLSRFYTSLGIQSATVKGIERYAQRHDAVEEHAHQLGLAARARFAKNTAQMRPCSIVPYAQRHG